MIRAFADAEAASRAAAAEIATRAAEAVAARGRFCLALAGGRTPRRTYELLATDFRDRIPWGGVEVLWGDERCVRPDDPRSNYAMARSALLDHVGVSEDRVHRIRCELGPAAAAHEYAQLISSLDALDLAFLGAGEDGHTASLFPGQIEPDDPRWARGVRAPAGIEPRERVTLTLRALNAFERALFLVTGREKSRTVAAVQETMTGPGRTAVDLPACRVSPRREPLWIVDRAAADARTSGPGSASE